MPAVDCRGMDAKVTVGELKGLVAGFIRERDWEKFHNPKDLAVAISVEAAELLEHFLWEGQKNGGIESGLADEVREELADVAIYCLSLANAQGWDLSEAIQDKIRKNSKRFPVKDYKGVARLP